MDVNPGSMDWSMLLKSCDFTSFAKHVPEPGDMVTRGFLINTDTQPAIALVEVDASFHAPSVN